MAVNPHDSRFYMEQPFISIQEKSLRGNQLVILDDLNARVVDRSHFTNAEKRIRYEVNCDNVTNLNGKTYVLFQG